MASKDKNLRFALIGCGKIANHHGNVIANALEGATLAAVVDSDLDRAKTAAERWNCNHYTDIDSMLSQEEIEVVNVLTDSGSHAKVALEVIPRVKNVVVEKPLALRVADADKMLQAAKEADTRLFVVKQVRYFRPVAKVREYFDAGRFGKMVMGSVRVRYTRTQDYYDSAPWRGTWLHDGGVIANQAIHLIDLLLWFMGDVESLHTYSATRLLNMEAEDTAVVILKFKSGAVGSIEATVATRPKDLEGSVSLLGERGSVVVGGFAANHLDTWQFDGETEEQAKSVLEEYASNPACEFSYGHKEYLEAVMQSIHRGEEFHLSGEAGRESLRVVDAIYASAETGKEVLLDSDFPSSRLGRDNS